MIDICLHTIWEFHICYAVFLLFLKHTAWKYTFCFHTAGWCKHTRTKVLQLVAYQLASLSNPYKTQSSLLILPSVLIKYAQEFKT